MSDPKDEKPPVEESTDRKPKITEKEPAQIKLNRFLKENGILIGTNKPVIDYTGAGSIIINAPTIIAIYEEEANGRPTATN